MEKLVGQPKYIKKKCRSWHKNQNNREKMGTWSEYDWENCCKSCHNGCSNISHSKNDFEWL